MLRQKFLQSTYFYPAQQLWQVVVVNQKEVAAANILGQQSNGVPVPLWLLSLDLPRHSRQQEQAVRNKAWSSCLNILMLVALTHKDLHPSVIFCRPCKTPKESFSLWKSSQSWAGIQAKNFGNFVDSPHEVSCQILLILSLNLSWIHSLNSILTIQTPLFWALFLF